MRRLLQQGLIAGLAGGAALAIALAVLGEGPIGDAIALEHAGHGEAGEEMFSRGTQQGGGVVAALIFAAAVGALFAVAYGVLRPRTPAHPWRLSMGLAAVGFVAVFLVPFLKYPANPPAVGDPATITERTVLYLTLLGWSLVAAWASWRAWRRLSAPPEGRHGQRQPSLAVHLRAPAVAALWLGLVATGWTILPPSPDPVEVPANLLWHFRLATVAGAAAMWAVLGTAFAWLQLGVRREVVSGAGVGVGPGVAAGVDVHDRA